MSVNKIVVEKAYKINVDKLFDMCNESDVVWGLYKETFKYFFNGTRKIRKIQLHSTDNTNRYTNIVRPSDPILSFTLAFDGAPTFWYNKELFDVLYNVVNLTQEEFEI